MAAGTATGPVSEHTTAPVNPPNAAVAVTTAAFVARTQETVGGVTTASGESLSQEAQSAAAMNDVKNVRVV